MPLIMRLLLLCGLLLATSAADAACTTSPAATATVGARTSYDIRAGGIPPVAASPTLTCTGGSLLSLVPSDYAQATTSSANGFRLRSAGGDLIGYRLAADSAGATVFTQGGTLNYLDPAMIGLLGLLSATSFSPPIYASLTEAPNVPAGTYTDTVTVAWSWAICRGIGVGGLCLSQERGTGTATLTVTVTVTADCRISAPAVDFGSAPLASRFAAVTQVLGVDCTKGTAYSIAFTAGTGGISRPWRQMRDGQGRVLRYNLYRPDGATIWDGQNPLAPVGGGTGATMPPPLHTYVARIDPAQATPPAASYTDTVSVVVSF